MAKKRKLSWYGVRTLFRFVAVGKPKVTDRHFDATSTLVEDRVVLFRADTFDSAIKHAEAEAREYCNRTRYVNIYGQSVQLKSLGVANAYSLYEDEPSAGCEVYSATTIVPRIVSDVRVVAERFGKADGGGPKRYKFMDGEILKTALTAIKTHDAPARRRR
ncbi:MAG: DUF4288 domain-containing protein [Candidatus Solibacter sp.]|nr:DUF4288 domain-containing protein [Candidatus Solibacter sp.]